MRVHEETLPRGFRNLVVAGTAAAVLVLLAIVLLTRPITSLQTADSRFLLIAVGSLALSQILCNTIWAYVLTAQQSVRGTRAFTASTASLLGVVTPLGLGTDVLRSLYSKRYLGVEYQTSVAATVISRTLKTHASLVVVVVVAAAAAAGSLSAIQASVAAIGTVVMLLAALYSLRLKRWTRLTSWLGTADIAGSIRHAAKRITRPGKATIIVAFMTSFLLDWVALHYCILAVGLTASLAETALLFGTLFCLSRAAFLPQGIGPTEVGGFAMLNSMDAGMEQTGAVLVLWDIVRFLVPLALAIACSLPLRSTKCFT